MVPDLRITIERWNPDTEKWENKTRITLNDAMKKILAEAAFKRQKLELKY